MEPRSFDRGKCCFVSLPKSRRVLQWSRDRLIAESHGAIAAEWITYTLQWSRDRLIAESNRTTGPHPHGSGASMEPRSFDRGKKTVQHVLPSCNRASMEPRSFDRGKVIDDDSPNEVKTSFNGAAIV